MSNQISPAKLLAEFVGTFALIFIGAGATAVIGSSAGLPGVAAIAFAHGLTVMAFTFAYGTVSGGHFNPSVTVAVLVAGAMRVDEAAGYVVSQFAGGILGAFLLRAGLGTPDLAHNLGLGAMTLTLTPWAGYVIEAVLGFFLSTVVLSTAVAGRAGNLAPLAIGVTLIFNIIMGGPLTGAAFNPARALGPMIATSNFSDAWLYLTAPIVGAIVAAILHIGLAWLVHERAATGLDRVARTPAE